MPAASKQPAFFVDVHRQSKPASTVQPPDAKKQERGANVKKLIIALVALVPLTGAAEAQNLKDFFATVVAAWNKPTEPFKIIDNVYYVGTNGLASYLITSPQ